MSISTNSDFSSLRSTLESVNRRVSLIGNSRSADAGETKIPPSIDENSIDSSTAEFPVSVAALLAELTSLRSELESKSSDLVMAGEIGSLLVEKNEAAQSRIDELSAEIENLRDRESQVAGEFKLSERRAKRLQDELKDAEKREIELREREENLRTEISRLAQRSATKDENSEILTAEVSKIEISTNAPDASPVEFLIRKAVSFLSFPA